MSKDPKAYKKTLEELVKSSDHDRTVKFKVMGKEYTAGVGLSETARSKVLEAIKMLAKMIPMHIDIPVWRP